MRAPIRSKWKNKWLLLPLALLFSLLSLSRLWLSQGTAEPTPLCLTVTAERLDNALCAALSEAIREAEPIFLKKTAGRIVGVTASPSRFYAKDGEAKDSVLYSDLTLYILLPLTLRDGAYYANGQYLAIGQKAALSSATFLFEGRIAQISSATPIF